MAGTVLDYTPLVRHWPNADTAITVFRYALVREMCRGKRVLEIGAAAGEGTALLADAAEVVAVDLHDFWSRSPAAALPNVRFVQGDALNLPAEWDGRFDVVVALELIEHLPDPAALQRAAHRVLADGGIFVFSTPNFDLYSAAGDDSRTPIFQHHLREYRAAELDVAVLDIWGARRIAGISQLSIPRDAAGSDGFAFLYDTALYDVVLGEKYPTYDLHRVGTLDAPMPLHTFQSFLVTVSKGPGCAEAGLSAPAGSAAIAAPSTAEAAFRSCQVILRRKNEHIRNLERHAGNLEVIVADREARLAATQGELRVAVDYVERLQHRLPNRIADWIGRVLRLGRRTSVNHGER
jgi:SAM-dependent methyltransferase